MTQTRMILISAALLVATACAESANDPPQPQSSATASDPGSERSSPALDGPVGTLGAEFLGATFSGVRIEIDSSDGHALTDRARAALEDRLLRHGNKDRIDHAGGSTVPSQEEYSDDDLRQIAAEHRSAIGPDGWLTMYVLVLDGRHEEDDVVGLAFDASSFAIFPEQIQGGLLGLSYDRYEEAVAVHELGHLFGLVNLSGEGSFHEDGDHPGHSANEGSVMFWRVEDASLTSFFDGGPPTRFDADDRREMDAIRG